MLTLLEGGFVLVRLKDQLEGDGQSLFELYVLLFAVMVYVLV
jgi:hypothetical protein